MTKYIDIKAILNYIPNSIRDDAGDKRLLSYAFQALRIYVPQRIFLGLAMIVRPIINHKVNLEEGTRRIEGVWYLEDLERFTTTNGYLFVTDNDGLKDNSQRDEFVSEKTISYEDIIKHNQPMCYMGEHGFLVNNEYLSFYDGDCHLGFSVDYNMTCLTTDVKTGYAIVLYQEFKQSSSGFLVPDDANFLQALAYAAEAQAWRERSANKEQGAEGMYQTRQQEARSYFISANGRKALRDFRPSAVLDHNRNYILSLPEISGNNKNNRYNRTW